MWGLSTWVSFFVSLVLVCGYLSWLVVLVVVFSGFYVLLCLCGVFVVVACWLLVMLVVVFGVGFFCFCVVLGCCFSLDVFGGWFVRWSALECLGFCGWCFSSSGLCV